MPRHLFILFAAFSALVSPGCVDYVDDNTGSDEAWNLEESSPESGGCVTPGGHDWAAIWGTTDDGAHCAEVSLLSGPPAESDIDVSQLELDDWWHVTGAVVADSCSTSDGASSAGVTEVTELAGIIETSGGYDFDVDIDILLDDGRRLSWSDRIEATGTCR